MRNGSSDHQEAFILGILMNLHLPLRSSPWLQRHHGNHPTWLCSLVLAYNFKGFSRCLKLSYSPKNQHVPKKRDTLDVSKKAEPLYTIHLQSLYQLESQNFISIFHEGDASKPSLQPSTLGFAAMLWDKLLEPTKTTKTRVKGKTHGAQTRIPHLYTLDR